jgi:hypothetical protein
LQNFFAVRNRVSSKGGVGPVFGGVLVLHQKQRRRMSSRMATFYREPFPAILKLENKQGQVLGNLKVGENE